MCLVSLKLAQWFWRRILNFDNTFPLFCYNLSLKKGGAFHMNKLESQSRRNAFWQFFFFKIGPIVLEKILLICQWIILLFPYHLHLEKGTALHFHKSECSSTKNALFPILVEIDSTVFEKKMKMWKVNRWTDRWTDDTQPMIRKAYLRFQIRWAKDACHLTSSCLIISGTILFTWILSEVESILRQRTFIIEHGWQHVLTVPGLVRCQGVV